MHLASNFFLLKNSFKKYLGEIYICQWAKNGKIVKRYIFQLGIKQVNCIMRLLPLFSLVKKCPEVQGFLQKVYVFKKILYYTVMPWYIELYISDGFGYLKLGFKLLKIIQIFREINFTKKYIPEFRAIHTRMHHLKTVYSMFALQVVTQTSYLLGEHTGSRGKQLCIVSWPVHSHWSTSFEIVIF